MPKFTVDVYMASRAHMEYFEEELSMTWLQAFRLWRSAKFAPKVFLHVEDREANTLLETLLREQYPKQSWFVDGCLGIRYLRANKGENMKIDQKVSVPKTSFGDGLKSLLWLILGIISTIFFLGVAFGYYYGSTLNC